MSGAGPYSAISTARVAGTGQRRLLHQDHAQRRSGDQRGGGAEHVAECGDHVGGRDRTHGAAMLAAERDIRAQRHQQDRA